MTADEYKDAHGEDGDRCRRCGEARCYCDCHREDDAEWPDPEARECCHYDDGCAAADCAYGTAKDGED